MVTKELIPAIVEVEFIPLVLHSPRTWARLCCCCTCNLYWCSASHPSAQRCWTGPYLELARWIVDWDYLRACWKVGRLEIRFCCWWGWKLDYGEIATSRRQQKVFIFCAPSLPSNRGLEEEMYGTYMGQMHLGKLIHMESEALSKGDKNASVCVDMMMAASIWWRKVANICRELELGNTDVWSSEQQAAVNGRNPMSKSVTQIVTSLTKPYGSGCKIGCSMRWQIRYFRVSTNLYTA